jgi:DNA-binding transcriptional regulator YbjK
MAPAAEDADDAEPAGYRRSRGSARGEARRRDLLVRVTDDLQTHGLADFSLRRAARAAGTTHKVLLYYFEDVDDLLSQAVAELRNRRIVSGSAAALEQTTSGSLVERVRALWPVLIGAEDPALEQAMGLAMYDPDRYAGLVTGATEDYLSALREICPEEWTEQRKQEVAQLVLAALRGLMLARRTSGGTTDAAAGLAALERALAREMDAPG